MKKRVAIIGCAVALVLSVGAFPAFAAETATEDAEDSYSYLAGQQRSQSRNALYAQAEEFATEEERDAFLAANGIGETEWSEEAAANFSYVTGHQSGTSYRSDDSEDNAIPNAESYSYLTGQQRGSSYNK